MAICAPRLALKCTVWGGRSRSASSGYHTPGETPRKTPAKAIGRTLTGDACSKIMTRSCSKCSASGSMLPVAGKDAEFFDQTGTLQANQSVSAQPHATAAMSQTCDCADQNIQMRPTSFSTPRKLCGSWPVCSVGRE
jgi:hypothetical protein